jgi:hypothetical protein
MWDLFFVSPTYFFRTLCLFKAQHITFISILSSTFYNLTKTMCRCFFCSLCCSITCLLKNGFHGWPYKHGTKLTQKHPHLFSQTMLDNSFSYLYGMAHQLNYPIVMTTLHPSYSCRLVPYCPLVKHLIWSNIWLNNLVRHDIVMFVGDRYPLEPLEGKKASREALGILSRWAIPSWARGELLVEWANARKK